MDNTSIQTSTTSTKHRYAWVDVVRGLGIILVFYGHYIQRGIDTQNASAIEQFRFIYSFHMPLFFILSGFFFRPCVEIGSCIRRLALRRLIPVIVFGLFLLPIWLHHELNHNLPFRRDITRIVFDYLDGIPDLNWVTWFLVCLFVCETLAFIVLSRLHGLKSQLSAAALFLIVGLMFCSYSLEPAQGWLYLTGRSWFLSESLVALGFYIIGYAAFPYLRKISDNRQLSAIIFLIAISIALLTYGYNHPHSIAVMMAARTHGNAFYFVLTALAGSLAVFSLAMYVQANSVLQLIGRNTLVLLGLNGLFFSYIDPRLLSFIVPANNHLVVTLDSLLVTIVSLLLCAPIVYVMNRFTPQLIGNITVSGPWLPALIKYKN